MDVAALAQPIRLPDSEPRVIAACLGKRFSGINASMAAVLPELANRIPIAAIGWHLPKGVRQMGWAQVLRNAWTGPWRIWHARRNVDMLVGLILRRLLRFKLILVFTSVAQRRHSWITRFYYHRMDALICPTRAAASYLDRPSVLVPHGVDTAAFVPPQDRAAAWAGQHLPGRYGIGVFGRIRPQKGTGEFVEAMIRVLPQRPDWTAVVVGQTTPEQLGFERALKARIQEAGLSDRFHFTGFLTDARQIPRWYQALSCVVCPSHVEGFGLPCLEAMASGCPVVATRTGAWPEVVTQGQDGYVVPCRDAGALTEAILKITADPAEVQAMGLRAREKVVRDYPIQKEAAGIMAVYEQLLRS